MREVLGNNCSFVPTMISSALRTLPRQATAPTLSAIGDLVYLSLKAGCVWQITGICLLADRHIFRCQLVQIVGQVKYALHCDLSICAKVTYQLTCHGVKEENEQPRLKILKEGSFAPRQLLPCMSM